MTKIYKVAGKMNKFSVGKLLMFICLSLCINLVQAQQGLATYTPVRTTGITFTSIAPTGTAIPTWRNGTSTDDNLSTAIPIGFSFLYDGVQICEVNVSTNGYLNFLTSTPNANNGAGTGAYGYQNTAFSSTTLRVAAPFYDDLICQGTSGAKSTLDASMKYTTTGSAPNRVFTIEWIHMKFFSGTSDITFQVKLFEGTNKISFVYGDMTASSSGSYSVGLNSVTLAGTPAAGMLFTQQTANTATFSAVASNALTTIPAANSQIDFTYGGAAVNPLSGVYAIPGAYASIGAAIKALNYHGTSGAVTFNVAAGSTFVEDPEPIQTSCSANAITFQCLSTNHATIKPTLGGINSLAAGIRIMGGDNIKFDGIDIAANAGSTSLNYGYLLTQNSNTNGAQSNTIQNCVVTLNRTNVNSLGFLVSSVLTPSLVVGGANSSNSFKNITVTNSFRGIMFNGASTVTYGGAATTNCSPDNGNILGSSSCTTYNFMGDPGTANDIGGNSTTIDPFGVASFNQANLLVANTKVQNVFTSGTIYADGIYISNKLPAATSGGTTTVVNNQVFSVKGTSTTSGIITGISLNTNNNAATVLRAYNNFVGDLQSASTSTTGRKLIGIGLSDDGVTSSGNIEVWHNSVSIIANNLACSNAALESVLSTTGPILTVKNNIFSNQTGAQSGAAKHYAIVSSSASLFGNTGSASNYNDLHVLNITNGFVGLGSTTDYATVANWTSGTGQDANSVNTDPNFNGSLDLHLGAVALNSAGTAAPGYITTDIDCQTRPIGGPNFDMGADETQLCAAVAGGTISPAVDQGCELQSYTLDAVGATTGIGITLQWQVSTDNVTFVDATGGSPSNTTPYYSPFLAAGTYYYRLKVRCSNGGATTYSNTLTLTINPAPTVNVSPATGFLCQPGASAITLTASGTANSYAWSPATGLSGTTGASVNANPLLTTTYTVTGTNSTTGCTKTATSVITVGASFSLIPTATEASICSGGNSQLNAAINSNANEVLITEVTLFRTGTGATASYPAYVEATAQDFVEISNITSSSIDISGWKISDYGNNASATTHTLTFPAGTIIPASANAVIHLGGGTNNIASRYFNTGGTTDFWTSGNQMGVVLRDASNNIVDVVGLGGDAGSYTFNAATGVTGTNWTGFAPNLGGFAGVIRTAASDNNSGTDWARSTNPPTQSIGTYNGGYASSLNIATWTWTPSTFLSATNIQNPIATAVTGTTTYNVNAVSSAGCSASASVTVFVQPLTIVSITSTGNRCVGVPTTVTANTTGGCAPFTYSWTIDGVSTPGTTATITPTVATSGSHNFAVTVTSANGNAGPFTQAITINGLPTVTVSPAASSICNPGGTAVTLTASGATTYTWNPSNGLSGVAGTSVTALPDGTTTYTASGTDGNGCVGTGSATVSVGPAITATAASSVTGNVCYNANTTLTATVVYPTFDYCNSDHSSGCGLNDEITRVRIATTALDNTSTCAPSAYTYFNGGGTQTGTVTANTSINITVNFGSDGNQYFGAWIDYNQDGIFTTNEFLGGNTVNAGSNGSATVNFTVPATAYNGVTRLRVVGGNDSRLFSDQACGASSSIFGETEDYDITITGGTNPTTTYLWSPATYLSSTTTNPTTASNMLSTQTYNVTATTAAGCTANASVLVTVEPQVTATLSGTATICTGGSTNLSVALTGNAPWSITYTANGSPTTVTGIAASPYVFSVNPTVLTNYALTAVSTAICTGTFSGTATVTVNAVPTVSVTPSAPSICAAGAGVSLTASTTGGGSPTYSWSPATGLSATTGATVTANPGATTTYTVLSTSTFAGCNASADVTVTVNSNQPASVSVSNPGGTSVCSGSSLTFTAVPTNGGTPTYQWWLDGVSQAGQTAVTYTLSNITVNHSVYVVMTSSLCPSPNVATSATINITVVTNAAAAVTITPSATLCSGSPITFTASPANGGPGPQYTFYLNGSIAQGPGATATYPLPAPVNGDQVYAMMLSNLGGGCVTGNPATSATYTVALNPSPTNSAPTSSCPSVIPGNSFTLTNTAGPGSGSITGYQWQLAGADIPGATSSTYTTTVTGTYRVKVTNSNNCVTITNTVTVSPTSGPLAAGTYNIPGSGLCTDFQTIKSAVDYLNTNGVGGAVIFSIAGGYTETAPAGGYNLTATGTAANTITFKKASGASPKVTASAAHTPGSSTDAIFKLVGSDYITIQDLIMVENPANVNTTPGTNTMTEWGIALLHKTTTDGSQNNAIQFDSISLNRNYQNSFGLYSNNTHSATVPGTNEVTTTGPGQNSNNKIFGNKIGDVNTPLLFIGSPANMDVNNDIGGTVVVNGNTLTNWGSNTAPNTSSTVFINVIKSVYGVYAANQTTANVSFNNITSAANINYSNALGFGLKGIYTNYTGTPSGTFTNTIDHNFVTVSSATTLANDSSVAIYSGNYTLSSAVVATMTTNITNNTIVGCSMNAGASTHIVGIKNNFPCGVLNISSNTIRSNTSIATAGGISGIQNTAAVATSITMDNNKLGDATGNFINLNSGTGTSGNVVGINNTSGNNAGSLSIQNNDIRGIVYAVSSSGANVFIANSFKVNTQTISNNTFTNLNLNTTGNTTFINNSVAVNTGGTQNVNNNSVVTGFTQPNLTGSITFYNASSSSVAPVTITQTGNNFSNIHFAGSGSLSGWVSRDDGASSKTVSNNTFAFISSGSGSISAILNISGMAASPGTTVSNNIIDSITAGGTATCLNFPLGVTYLTATLNSITRIKSTGGAITAVNSLLANANLSTTTVNNCVSTNGSVSGITASYATNTTNAIVINNNTVTNLLSSFVGGNSNAAGITISGANTNATVTNNSINGLSNNSTGAGPNIYGVQVTGGNILNISNNTINDINSNGGTDNPFVGGIAVSGTITVSADITKNNIYDLVQLGTPSFVSAISQGAPVTGIASSGAFTTKLTATNNFISDLRAPAVSSLDAIRGISLLGTKSPSTYFIYYNTVFLNATSSGTDFGTTGLYHAANGTSSIGTLSLRNNIFDNQSTPNGAGLTVAFRRSNNAWANYASSAPNISNNNVFYAGTPQASPRAIAYDGTSAYYTLLDYQGISGLAPRDNVSLSLKPNYINAVTTPYDLRLLASFNCSIDDAGDNTTILIPTDYEGTVRSTTSPFKTDIGADEFTSTGTGKGVWAGVNSNWEDPNNWCGEVPTVVTDVVIPAGKAFYPIITTSTPVARNIDINVGGTITVNISGTLSTKGTWTNNGTLTNNGTIVLNGSTAVSFPGAGTGTLTNMNNLTVSNTGGVTINKPLTIKGTLKPQAGNILVDQLVTLFSDVNGTARVDTLQGSFTYTAGTGKFSIERYISTPAKVGWRFLSAPIKAGFQTINQAWQEGMAAGSSVSTGYGTWIVGPSSAGSGFDVNNTLPSLKKHNPATNVWDPAPGTTGDISQPYGYMIFVRGDRGADLFGETSPTKLRTIGEIKSGNITVSIPNASINQFISVGNPYPSAIDYSSAATIKTGLADRYYVWDPKLSTYGAYQVFQGPGYVASPGGGSYGGGNKFIESGQAFFVQADGNNAPHSILIKENSKVGSNVQVARQGVLESNLATRVFMVSNGENNLVDGNRVDFDATYSNDVNIEDAPKMSNFGQNLGIKQAGKILAVERHAPLVNTDTIFYQLNQFRSGQYMLELSANGLGSTGLTGYLEDNFLHSRTVIPMDAVTRVDFNVTDDVLSKDENRFRIVFNQRGPVPVTFTTVRANRQDKDVMVSWSVENQLNIHHYEVEHSANGRQFSKLGDQAATGSNGASVQYRWLDTHPYAGDNFYRIKSVGIGGDVKYSEVVKVNMAGEHPAITVYPNPVQEDGMISISLVNQPKGAYQVKVLNAAGQTTLSKTINHDGSNSVYSFDLGSFVSHGHYVMQIAEGNKVKSTFKIVY